MYIFRAPEARERTLGAEHPSTLISVNNLAELLRAQGKLEDAAPLYQRALEAGELPSEGDKGGQREKGVFYTNIYIYVCMLYAFIQSVVCYWIPMCICL